MSITTYYEFTYNGEEIYYPSQIVDSELVRCLDVEQTFISNEMKYYQVLQEAETAVEIITEHGITTQAIGECWKWAEVWAMVFLARGTTMYNEYGNKIDAEKLDVTVKERD